MALKHNPFDSSRKGSLIQRKKVFENPPEITPSLLNKDAVDSNGFNRVQLGANELNKVQTGATKENDSQLGSNGFNKVQTDSNGLNRVQMGANELNKVQTGATKVNESQLGSNGCNQAQTDSIGFNRVQMGANELNKVQTGATKENDSQLGSNGFNKVQTDSNGLNRVQMGANELNKVQTGANDFNRVQTDSSIGFNRGQLGANEFINQAQTGAKGFRSVQTGSPIGFRSVQTGSNISKLSQPISSSELQTLRWMNHNKLEDYTMIFRRSECAAATGLTLEGAKTAAVRLREKGFIELLESRRGRYTGLAIYRITVKGEEILQSSSNTVTSFNRVQIGSNGFTNRVQMESSSSSSILNKETTTTDNLQIEIPLTLKDRLQLKKLYKFVHEGFLSAEDLENSLWGFAYDLDKGLVKARSGNTIAVLIGAIKGGGYISQQYLDEKEKDLAEVSLRKTRLQELSSELKQKKLEEEFEKFRLEFPDEANKLKSKLLPFFQKETDSGMGYKLWVSAYRELKESKVESTP